MKRGVRRAKSARARWAVAVLGAALVMIAGCSSSASSGGSKASASSGSSSAPSPNDCGVHKNQLCPVTVMPPAYNEATILKQLEATPAKTGSIASIVAADMANPTNWGGPTTPVPLPKKKLKLALISCEATLTGCVAPLDAIQGLGKRLGWSTTMYDGQGNPDVISADMLTSVAAHVDAIFIAGLDPTTLQQGMSAAKKANIPVVSITSCLETPNPIDQAPPGDAWPIADVAQNCVSAGRALADWVIKDSGGKAQVVVLSDRENESQIDDAAAVDEINKLCPDCKTYTYTLLGVDVATTFPQESISFLRSHPDVKYIILPYDPAASALVPALAQAGMTDVKLLSVLGIAQNLQFIRSGQSQVADLAWDNAYEGWAAVDQLLRYLNHQPPAQPESEGVPQILLDKNNVPSGNGNWATSINYQSEYLKLWGVQR